MAVTPYYYLSKNNVKIQVGSAVRDGQGRTIHNHYVRSISSTKCIQSMFSK